MAGRFNPYSLAGLTYLTHAHLGGLHHSIATGGSGTTLIDTRFLVQENDHWGTGENMGTLWLLSGGVSDGGDQVARIIGSTLATTLVTVADTLSPAAEALVNYAIAEPRYSLMEIISALNQAIYSLGKIVYTRTADYLGVAAQTEYGLVEQQDAADLPVVIDTDAEVLQIWQQTVTNDSNNNQWLPYQGNYYTQKSNIGTMNTLVFFDQPPVGYYLKFVLRGQHPWLFQYGARAQTELDQGVPHQLVTLKAASILLTRELGNDITHPRLAQMLEQIQMLEQQAQTQHSPLKPRPEPQLIMIPNYAAGGYYRNNDMVSTP